MSQVILPPGIPTKLNNAWFKDCYQQAILFYEKDQCLTSSDRLELAETYRDIATVKKNNGWLGFGTVFLTPFILRYGKTGSIFGTQISRNFFLGMITYVIVSYKTGQRELEIKINQLSQSINLYDEDYVSKEKRQLDVLKTLSCEPTMQWSNYFYKTYLHPECTFPNPQRQLQKFIDATNGLNSSTNNHADKSEIKTSNIKHIASSSSKTISTSKLYSSWDKIRENSANIRNSEFNDDQETTNPGNFDFSKQLEIDEVNLET